MESPPNVVTVAVPITQPEGTFAYVAVKGSLHASDSAVFGLNADEVKALSKRFANSTNVQIDKVKYLQHIKELPPGSYEQMAEISVMMGRSNEAETILLHNNKISEAIELCVRMHRWERALDISKTHKNHTGLEWVLRQRKKYMTAINREEYLPIFRNFQYPD